MREAPYLITTPKVISYPSLQHIQTITVKRCQLDFVRTVDMAPPVTPSKRKRSSPIQDVKFERVEGEGLEDEVLPKTPIKRKREEPAKKLSTPPPSTPKRGSVAPKTPSKSALKKAERERKKAEGERKKQWEKDWEDEVKRSVWPTDRKHIQTLGSNEIHRTEGKLSMFPHHVDWSEWKTHC